MKNRMATVFLFSVLSVQWSALAAIPPLILVPDAPTSEEKAVAAHLADEIAVCTGPIGRPVVMCERASRKGFKWKIFVGATRKAREMRGVNEWKPGEAFIKSGENALVIDGDPEKGLALAVEAYLEKCCGIKAGADGKKTYPSWTDMEQYPLKGIDMKFDGDAGKESAK